MYIPFSCWSLSVFFYNNIFLITCYQFNVYNQSLPPLQLYCNNDYYFFAISTLLLLFLILLLLSKKINDNFFACGSSMATDQEC